MGTGSMKKLSSFPLRDLVVIVATLLTFGGAVVEGLTDAGTVTWTLPALASAVLLAVPVGVRAFVKYSVFLERRARARESDPPDTPIALGLVAALMLVIVCSGCAMNGAVKTHFRESITDTDGTVDNFEYDAASRAGVGGTLDTSVHKLDYAWGGAENKIGIGQGMKGLDDSRQAALLDSIAEKIADVIKAVIEKLLQPAPLPGPAVPEEPAPIDVGPLAPLLGR